jgi:hypothetical protein
MLRARWRIDWTVLSDDDDTAAPLIAKDPFVAELSPEMAVATWLLIAELAAVCVLLLSADTDMTPKLAAIRAIPPAAILRIVFII